MAAARIAERLNDRLSRSDVVSKMHEWIYRVTGGRIGAHLKGIPVLLLTTEGRRSHKRRTVTLMYMPAGDRTLVVGSNSTNIEHNPAWWFNLQAKPEAEVQIRSARHPVRAAELDAEEREAVWPRLIEHNPRWAIFQSETERRIPVVALSIEAESG